MRQRAAGGSERGEVWSHVRARPLRPARGGLGPGRPLDDATRRQMEVAFDADLSPVRVHDDAAAAAQVRELGAVAFTLGTDVAFGANHYAPSTNAGRLLIAHELTHVLQQRAGGGLVPSRVRPDRGPDAEADRAARAVVLERRPAPPVRHRAAGLQLQRDPAAGDVAEFEADRARFEAAQDEYFGAMTARSLPRLLSRAGLSRAPSTPAQALAVVAHWGVTIDTLKAVMPAIAAARAGELRGRHDADEVSRQEQAAVQGLSARGRDTYQQMLARVNAEPFWREHLATREVHIFPDLPGDRYSGTTARGTATTLEGGTPAGVERPVFLVRLPRRPFEDGDTDRAVATLVHELSHTVMSVNVTERILRPLEATLAELLADHPEIVALRRGAPNGAEQRRAQVARIKQLLYERTGYAEAEIFVHLQQLSHQPDVVVDGETVPADHYILDQVTTYAAQLTRIGLPDDVLAGVLASLHGRTADLYDRRIAAAPAGSRRRRLLTFLKDEALLALGIAIQ